MKSIAVLVCVFFIAVVPVVAQLDCPASMDDTMTVVLERCVDTGVNEVCYGNGVMTVEPRDGEIVFDEPGATIDAAAIELLTLLREAEPISVAVLRPRANLPESSLTMVVFGQVTLHNDSQNSAAFAALPATVTSGQGANVRQSPADNAPITTQLTSGQSVVAVGRTRDSVWIRLTDGWVAAGLLGADYDWGVLEVLAAAAEIPSEDDLYAPFQAFNFRSAMDDAPCSAAPDSGILIQRPDEPGDAALVVNGIQVAFNGTLYLQSPMTGQTIISVLEGELYVDDDVFQIGDRVEWSPAGRLSARADYHYARLQELPLHLLPRFISLPFSLGGLLQPFDVNSNLLYETERDAPCLIVWTNGDINLRAGPGIEYPVRQGVPANFSAHPDAQGISADGALWWRLAEGIWVQSGVVVAAGACIELPIAPAPPLPEND